MKNVLLLLAALAVAFCVIPAAGDEVYPAGLTPVPGISIPSIYEGLNASSPVPLMADSFPSSYDLRDYGYVTSVKDQSSFGTCWAFSVISSLESNAIVQGYETSESADFSELQLAYFMYNRDGVTTGNILPELSGLEGDDVRLLSGTYLSRGGNEIFSMHHLATGIGIVSEDAVPYTWATEIYDQKRNEGLSSSAAVAEASKLTLSPEYAVSKNQYILSNVSFVSIADRDAIKQLLMEVGCGVLGYYNDNIYFNQADYHENLNSMNYYQNEYNSTYQDHDVTLVGWDDNYPKENFITTPEHNGAWLLKNSWGENWGDEGYFWISYEDTSLDAVYFYEVRPAKGVDTIYQYDGGVSTAYRSGISEDGVLIAASMNVFTAQDEELITDISFVTLNPNVYYSVRVLTEETQVPTAIEGYTTFCGYHTLSLPTPFRVQSGEEFAVLVTLAAPENTVDIYGRNVLALPYDRSSSHGWVDLVSSSKPEQGAVIRGSEVIDGNTLLDGAGVNFRIKAFGVNSGMELVYPYIPTALKEGTVLVNITDPSSTITVEGDGRIISDLFGEYRIEGAAGDRVYCLTQPDAHLTFTDTAGNRVDSISKSSGLTISIEPTLPEYQPEALLFTLPTGSQITSAPLSGLSYTVQNLETVGALSGEWSVQVLYNSTVLPGMPEEYLVGNTVYSGMITPSVSSGGAAVVSERAFDLLNAETPAIVSVDAVPKNLGDITAPAVVRGEQSIVVNSSVTAVKWVAKTPYEISISLNPDNSLNLSATDLSKADAVTLFFVGCPLGDVTGDGAVSTIDAARILQASANIVTLDTSAKFYGDVNGDGKTTTLDAARILQYSAKLTDNNYNLV